MRVARAAGGWMRYFFKRETVIEPRMADRNREFDEETLRGFQRYCASAPEVATFAGIFDHDDKLPPATEAGLMARLEIFGDWAKRLDAFDRASLSSARATDADLLQLLNRLLRFEVRDVRPWQSNPDALGDLGNLFFVTAFADYPSEELRFERIAARLEALPEYLAETRARVTKPEPRWCRIAVEVAQSFPSMLDGLMQGAKGKAP